MSGALTYDVGAAFAMVVYQNFSEGGLPAFWAYPSLLPCLVVWLHRAGAAIDQWEGRVSSVLERKGERLGGEDHDEVGEAGAGVVAVVVGRCCVLG